MLRPVRIGNAHGFWGDRLEAACEMLAREPDLDFLTLDFLAEVSMSILALQRSRDPQAGWPRDFVEIVRSIAPYWRGGGRCRVITNAGGLNPLGCARACCEVLKNAGLRRPHRGRCLRRRRARSGPQRRPSRTTTNCCGTWTPARPIAEVRNRLVTANAYLGRQADRGGPRPRRRSGDHRPRGRSQLDRRPRVPIGSAGRGTIGTAWPARPSPAI